MGAVPFRLEVIRYAKMRTRSGSLTVKLAVTEEKLDRIRQLKPVVFRSERFCYRYDPLHPHLGMTAASLLCDAG